MSELVKNIFEKLSSYQLFNFFYLGAIFILLIKYHGLDIMSEMSTGIFLLSSHFMGLTLSRIGSLIIEDSMIYSHFIEEFDYKEYANAEKKDSKIQLLLEIANTYRTLSATFLVLTILILAFHFFPISCMSPRCCLGLLYFLLFLLFAIAFKKQYKYLIKRIEANQ